MVTHDDILTALRETFPGENGRDGVFLVARLHDDTLGLDDPTPHVFVPDTHVTTRADVRRFPRSTADESQVDALARLLQTVLELRARDPMLVFWHLGDFVDLWRVGNEDESVRDRMQRVEQDRSNLVDLLKDLCPNGFRTRVLAGNHDLDLREYDWNLSTEEFINRADAGAASAMVLHGHQFDPIESLPQRIKEFFARGATEAVPPAARTMLEATNPHWKPQPITAPLPKPPRAAWRYFNANLPGDHPLPLDEERLNVLDHTPEHDPAKSFVTGLASPGSKPSADPPSQTFFSDASWWADAHARRGRDVRLAVIGHTHRPRIVRGKRTDGTPFVLMDCGAWTGLGFLSKARKAPIRRQQIGVKVGNDLRIYQLGYDPAS